MKKIQPQRLLAIQTTLEHVETVQVTNVNEYVRIYAANQVISLEESFR